MALSVIKTNSIAAGNITSALISSVSATSISGTIVGTQLGEGIIGQVGFFSLNVAPTGWIKANGSAISRTTYATLFGIIGTTFGAGDGSTTFNVPDLRGYFPRGWADNGSVDSGRTFGTTQSDDFKSHTHYISGFGNGSDLNGGPFAGSGTRPAAYTATSSGGSETRPINIALLACIKY